MSSRLPQWRFRVDTNVRAAYLQFTDEPIVETIELTPSVLVDIDATDTVVGVELLSLNAVIPVDVIERTYRFASDGYAGRTYDDDIRSQVSVLWAEDWDSDGDAIYDNW